MILGAKLSARQIKMWKRYDRKCPLYHAWEYRRERKGYLPTSCGFNYFFTTPSEIVKTLPLLQMIEYIQQGQ